MRESFDSQLEQLRAELAEVCGLTAVAVEQATCALLDLEVAAADRTNEVNADIDARSRELDHRVLTLLALQAPVAQDLRVLISALHNIADLRRMGSLAAHIAEVARMHHPAAVVPEELRGMLSEMGKAARAQAEAAQEVLRHRDKDAAEQLIASDDRMDGLLRDLFVITKGSDWPHGAASAVNITLLGRFYERFCDHTVEISRRIIFAVTGQFPDP